MILLGHMLADLVEAHTPIQVDRRFNLGGTLVCYNALRQGGLDAYVEYTGTALTTILKEPVQTDPAAVLDRVRTELMDARPGRLPRPVRLREHVRHPDAAGPGRAAGHPDDLRPAGPPARHPPGLRPRVHEPPRRLSRPGPGLRPGVRPRPAGDGPQPALPGPAQGSLDLAAGDSTDGRIAAFDLVQLEDDRRYFPPYEAVPLVRAETLERFPQLREVLNRLAGKIDAATMRQMNREVDQERKEAGGGCAQLPP